MTTRYQLRGFRITAVIVAVLVAAALVWYFAIRDTGNGGKSTGNIVGPVAATRADLVDLSKKLGQPVYWAGHQPRTSDLELTETRDGNVFVRYLTKNAPIGVPKPHYLTIGTYPVPNSIKALKNIGGEPGATTKKIPHNGVAVTNSSSPTSVYVAYPDERSFEIEVFDSDPTHALHLVTVGKITTVR